MPYINFKAAGTQCAIFGLTGAALGTTATDALIFAETGKSINLWPNGGTTGVIINSSGNVGIGTASPSTLYRATINGDGSSIVGGLSLRNNGTETLTIGNITASNNVDSEIWNPRNGYLRFATNNAERLRIDSSGNVGIGTSSPTSFGAGYTVLDVYNATNGGYVLARGSTAIGQFSAGTTVDFGSRTASNVNIVYNNDIKATVSSTGLAVTGQIAVGGSTIAASIRSTFTGNTIDGISLLDSADQSNADFAVFRKANSTSIGSIRRVTTTDAVAYNTTSDGRLKENLRDFTDSGRLIDSLKPRVFDWKNSDENGKNVVGFIAQEQHAADPIFAHIGAVSVGDEDPKTITKQWQRSDAALIPILVAELQSLRARVAALETN